MAKITTLHDMNIIQNKTQEHGPGKRVHTE